MSLFGMYNMNMFGTSGLTGMFSGGLTSFGSGCMGMGGSLFTNCFGEVNYDAMAGYSVASALTNVAGMAINHVVSSNKAIKAENENNKEEIEKINQKIADLKSTNPEDKIDSSYDTNIETAKTNLDNASKALTEARSQKSTLEGQLKAATTEEEKANIQKQIDALNIKEKEDEFNKLNGDAKTEGSVKYYEAKKEEAIKAQKAEIEQEIKQLENKKAQLQDSVDDTVLDQADGSKWKRTTKENFDKKWNQVSEDTEFTKGDMRYAIAGFRNATTTEEKKEWANKIATIYKNMSQSDITSDFKAARQIVDKYVD